MKTFAFSVWRLDVLPDEDGLWIENDRCHIGDIKVRAEDIDEIHDWMLLKAMYRLKIGVAFGRDVNAISTIDRRRVYAEDYSGDGTWWEVGEVKGMKPLYGLKLDGIS